MPDHSINITRSGNNLSVSSDPETVKPNENLQFCCDDDFVVFFKNNRDPHLVPTRRIVRILGRCSVPVPIRHLTVTEKQHPNDPVQGNKFSYGIAVLKPPAGPILTLDPDIIIDDGGGGDSLTKGKKKSAPKKRKKG